MSDIASFFRSPPPLFSCALFCFLSLVLTLHNKYVLDDVFRSSNGLLVFQCVFSIVALLMCRRLRLTNEFHANPLQAGNQEWACAFCAALNVVTGLGALAFLNVVMHGVMKRLTCVASWLIELLVEPKPTTMRVLPAILVMIFGSIVASLGDFKFSFIGTVLALISCFAQGGMFELGRMLVLSSSSSGNSEKQSGSGGGSGGSAGSGYAAVLYLNSVATLLMAGSMFALQSAMTAATPVDEDARQSLQLMPSGFAMAVTHVCFNACVALFMNYAVFLNCAVNSALAQAVTGNVKAMLQTIGGALLFTTHLSHSGWVGVGFNIGAAVWFSIIRMPSPSKKVEEEEEEEEEDAVV